MNETIPIYLTEIRETSSHELLRRAASLLTGLDEEDFHTGKAPLRKPYFLRHPELHFSVSHSGFLWICAFADREIGCDIQLHTVPKRPDAIVRRYFHPNEQSLYETASDKLTAFHLIWCRKEAAVKRTGHGIDDTFRKTDTTAPGCGITDIPLTIGGYSCAVSYDREICPDIRSF